MIKTAVIMAAGLGTRFGKKTELIPKSFIEVHNKTMISRSIETLIDCGIERIIIGTGYKSEMFDDLNKEYAQIETLYSERYAKTNSMQTLYVCGEIIGNDDFILLESDLIYEKKAISELIKDPRADIMLVSNVIKFQDQYYIESNEKDELVNCSVDENNLTVCGELVGIHKLSNLFFEKLKYYYSLVMLDKPTLGYEFGLLHIAQNVMAMHTLKIDGLQWYEIDDDNDLEYAEKMINTNYDPPKVV